MSNPVTVDKRKYNVIERRDQGEIAIERVNPADGEDFILARLVYGERKDGKTGLSIADMDLGGDRAATKALVIRVAAAAGYEVA